MIRLTSDEQTIVEAIRALKAKAGSHSPSMYSLAENIPQLKIAIDACFLSNPYATQLFLRYLHDELVLSGELAKLLEHYPSQGRVIADILAAHLEVPARTVFTGNGSTEIIQALLHTFSQRTVAVILPTFSPYYEFVPAGKTTVFWQLRKEQQFALDVDAYVAFVRQQRADTAVIINPNNPDGGYIEAAKLRQLLDKLAFVDQVIVDESFIHFSFERGSLDYWSAVPLTKTYANLVVVKSMSKDFGIAGVRAGYAVMAPERVAQLERYGYLWNISGLAEYFFRLYARYSFAQEYAEVRLRYVQEAQQFLQRLQTIPGIVAYPSLANFALVEIVDGSTSADVFYKLLIAHGIYTRDCSDKKGLTGEFLRIAARTQMENQVIIAALCAVFSPTLNEGSLTVPAGRVCL